MLLNDQGWFLPAGHTLGEFYECLIHTAARKIDAATIRFGNVKGELTSFHLIEPADLGIGKLSGYTARKNQ